MSQDPVILDDEWYELTDHPNHPKCRNVRGSSGIIIGRVLRDDGKFKAEVYQLGAWCSAGEFIEFERAVYAASSPTK
jgi:hypothetical protein